VKILDMAWVKKDKMQRPQGSDCAYRVGVASEASGERPPNEGAWPAQAQPVQWSEDLLCSAGPLLPPL
jgi:hypothetical protein